MINFSTRLRRGLDLVSALRAFACGSAEAFGPHKAGMPFAAAVMGVAMTLGLFTSTAQADGLSINNSDIQSRSFASQSLRNSHFMNLVMTNVVFQGADLTGSKFLNVDFDKVDFRGANLTDVTFMNCDILGPVYMDGAVTVGVETRNCDMPFSLAPVAVAPMASPATAPAVTPPTPPTPPTQAATPPTPPTLMQASTIAAGVMQPGRGVDVRVSFEYDSARLDSQGVLQAEQILQALRSAPAGVYLLTGHTDSDGDDAYNDALSGQRAEAVAAYLMQNGYPRDNLRVLGAGEREPVADNGTDAGKQMNRRVTITRMQ